MEQRRKFFFDNNKFDEEPIIIEPEYTPPPPPSFSLDELGSAKEIAFEEGRLQGLREAELQRAQYLAEQAEKIAKNLAELTSGEQYRNAVFEREVLELLHNIMEKAFPHFTALYGAGEIKAMISSLLQTELTTPNIVVEVPIDDAEEIQNFMDSLNLKTEALITVRANPSLKNGDCKLLWRDGGAVRDHDHLTSQILKQLNPQKSYKYKTETNNAMPLAEKNENPHNDLNNSEGDS